MADSDKGGGGSQAIRDVPIDWEALEDAFENNAPEVHSYLHLGSGEVLRVVDGIADPEMHARIASDGSYLRIEPVSSREQYRWMERFIPMVEEPDLRSQLSQAIDGKGAFRRFKDVLMTFGTERERWFAFRSERLRVFMEAWLAAHALRPVAREGWAGEPRKEIPPISQDLLSGRRTRSADALRKQVREIADTLGARDLEKVLAFAEFVKARRAARTFAHRFDGTPSAEGEIEVGEAPAEEQPSSNDDELLRRASAPLLAEGWRRLSASLALALLVSTLAAGAAAEPIEVERVAVRFSAPELGGARSPRFVMQRVLAFEARLAALSSGERVEGYRERHLSAALERHVAETLLANLRIEPEPSAELLTRQAVQARRILEDRVGGAEHLLEAARAESISERELLTLLRRQARASLYLDRMVAPMLQPSNAELRALHRSARTPFSSAPFETVLPGLKRWYVSTRLNDALQNYYQNARSRLEVVVLALPSPPE